jgi:transcriptional regulator with XRE-family HTH domain
MPLTEVWGSAVAARRKELGFSQEFVANQCEVTQQTISKIESGRLIPMDALKIRLANTLGTTPGELFAWPPMEHLVHEAAAL